MNNSILVLGAFGYYNNHLDGQTIKSRNVYELIQKHCPQYKVNYFDTLEIRRKPFLLFRLIFELLKCKKLILIPCLNNLTYLFPVLYFFSKIFGYEIIHVCVGGWQIEYFKGNSRFRAHHLQLFLTKKIKVILPEMRKVDQDLRNDLGLCNSEYFPNFRFFDLDKEKNVKIYSPISTLRMVFMARINKNKGYETIFNFLDCVDSLHLNISIDFYGPIEKGDRDHFESMIKKHSSVATYRGVVQPEDVQKTLACYDLMLFPTKYYTEGFPGTILDAYIAGIPVIATEWKHAREFIKDGETGYIVPFNDNQDEFNLKILDLYDHPDKLQNMKKLSLEQSLCYSEEVAWKIISKYI